MAQHSHSATNRIIVGNMHVALCDLEENRCRIDLMQIPKLVSVGWAGLRLIPDDVITSHT